MNCVITKFNYDSTTVNSLFLDVVNFADIEAIKNANQNWFIAGTCVNNSIITLRTLFEYAGIQITSPSFAYCLFEVFKDAGLDSSIVTLDTEGNIFFSFQNHVVSITVTGETLVYDFTSSVLGSIIMSEEYEYLYNLNIWEFLIEILNLLL